MKTFFALAALFCAVNAGVVIAPFKLFPDLPKEQAFNYTEIVMDNTLLKGFASMDNGMIYGLDAMDDDCNFNLLALKITCGEVILPAGRIEGDYVVLATLHFSNGTITELDAEGTLSAMGVNIRITKAVVDFSINIITSKLSVKEFDLTPSIEGCHVETTGDDLGNGERVDWEKVCEDFPGLVDGFWTLHGPSIKTDVKAAVNQFLKDKTLQDLIDLIGGGGSGRGLIA